MPQKNSCLGQCRTIVKFHNTQATVLGTPPFDIICPENDIYFICLLHIRKTQDIFNALQANFIMQTL